jgi:hypothetical protein
VCVVGNIDDREQEARAALYWHTATTLRQLAAEIRFDFRRRSQLLALADGFDRYAARIQRQPLGLVLHAERD